MFGQVSYIRMHIFTALVIFYTLQKGIVTKLLSQPAKQSPAASKDRSPVKELDLIEPERMDTAVEDIILETAEEDIILETAEEDIILETGEEDIILEVTHLVYFSLC